MIFLNNSIIGFQSPATPIMEGIIDLHNLIFFYLILVFVFIIWMFIYILYSFYIYPTIIYRIVVRNDINNYKYMKYFIFLYLYFGKIKTNFESNNLEEFYKNFKEDFVYSYNEIIKKEISGEKYEIMCNNLLVKLMNYQLDLIETRKIIEHTKLEIIWTIIPSFILVLIAIPSFSLLYSMDEIIDPKLTVKAIGYQWFWVYEYAQTYNKFDFDYLTDILDYNIISNKDLIIYNSIIIPEEELPKGYHRLLDVDKQLILPTNTHIRVLVTATDVLHSWAVPSLGIKMDAVPGRLNQVGIFLKREGVFYGQCSELCGVNHGFMPIAVKAVSYEEFLKWYEKIRVVWNME